jgi:hypothetical protein
MKRYQVSLKWSTEVEASDETQALDLAWSKLGLNFDCVAEVEEV